MPWHKHRNSKLVTHYGRWTKQEENDFYSEVNLEDWRGSGGFVLRGERLPLTNQYPKKKRGRKDD